MSPERDISQRPAGESITFDAIGRGLTLRKMRFRRRLLQELAPRIRSSPRRCGACDLTSCSRPTSRPDAGDRAPWRSSSWGFRGFCGTRTSSVLAIRSFAGAKLSRTFRLVAVGIEIGERWCSRQARRDRGDRGLLRRHPSPVGHLAQGHGHPELGTAGRDRPETAQQCLGSDARADRRQDIALLRHPWPEAQPDPSRGSGGAASPRPDRRCGWWSSTRARRSSCCGRLQPTRVSRSRCCRFSPMRRCRTSLASGDVLLVLLEKTAGVFSVPSKTLSYLCAGRPIIGLMPAENSAAELLDQVGSCVLPPDLESLHTATAWALEVFENPSRAAALGAAARALAEREFDLRTCADKFERILKESASLVPRQTPPGPSLEGSRT